MASIKEFNGHRAMRNKSQMKISGYIRIDQEYESHKCWFDMDEMRVCNHIGFDRQDDVYDRMKMEGRQASKDEIENLISYLQKQLKHAN